MFGEIGNAVSKVIDRFQTVGDDRRIADRFAANSKIDIEVQLQSHYRHASQYGVGSANTEIVAVL